VVRKWKDPKTSKQRKETTHAERILQAQARNTSQTERETPADNMPADWAALEASADQWLAEHATADSVYGESSTAKELASPTAKQRRRRAQRRRQRIKRLRPRPKAPSNQ